MFQNNLWKLIKLLFTALMWASDYGHIKTLKMLVEQEGIDVNAKNV